MSDARRFTTKYVPSEDRIQLLLEMKDGHVQVLWLTRRLLNRLLPRLLERLSTQAPIVTSAATRAPQKSDVVQKYTQFAAVSSIQKQPAVRPSEETPQRGVALVVTEVDIRTAPNALEIDFKGGAEVRQMLPFNEEALRQWLGVLHTQYRTAQWREAFWPSWMDAPANDEAARRLN